jgi:PncC family amidohydrolase
MSADLRKLAYDVAACLRSQNCRLVLAESCTGGLVAATLAQVSGISEFLCGSAVVYRLDTKTRWLGVSADVLIDPGPVSEAAANLMATGVLATTPEADLAAAITGHLGPNAPKNQDGLAFIALCRRGGEPSAQSHWLGDPIPTGMSPNDPLRERRQVRAAELVLRAVLEEL